MVGDKVARDMTNPCGGFDAAVGDADGIVTLSWIDEVAEDRCEVAGCATVW